MQPLQGRVTRVTAAGVTSPAVSWSASAAALAPDEEAFLLEEGLDDEPEPLAGHGWRVAEVVQRPLEKADATNPAKIPVTFMAS